MKEDAKTSFETLFHITKTDHIIFSCLVCGARTLQVMVVLHEVFEMKSYVSLSSPPCVSFHTNLPSLFIAGDDHTVVS